MDQNNPSLKNLFESQEGNLQHITQFISNDGGNGVVNLQRTRGRDDFTILSVCASFFFFLKPEPTSQDSHHSFLCECLCVQRVCIPPTCCSSRGMITELLLNLALPITVLEN